MVFNDETAFNKFQQEVSDLTFASMSRYNYIKVETGEDFGFKKSQFETISNTLYAMNTERSSESLYQLTDLSKAISPKHNKRLLSRQLKSGYPSYQLLTIKNTLKLLSNKRIAESAIKMINDHVKNGLRNAGIIGTHAHHTIEKFSVNYLLNKLGWIFKEDFNYELQNKENAKVPDLTLYVKDKFIEMFGDYQGAYIENKDFIEPMINFLVKDFEIVNIDFTMNKDSLKKKLKKEYHGSNKFLLIVAYNLDKAGMTETQKKRQLEYVRNIDKSLHKWCEKKGISQNFRYISLGHFRSFLAINKENSRNFYDDFTEIDKLVDKSFKNKVSFYELIDNGIKDAQYLGWYKRHH